MSDKVISTASCHVTPEWTWHRVEDADHSDLCPSSKCGASVEIRNVRTMGSLTIRTGEAIRTRDHASTVAKRNPRAVLLDFTWSAFQ